MKSHTLKLIPSMTFISGRAISLRAALLLATLAALAVAAKYPAFFDASAAEADPSASHVAVAEATGAAAPQAADKVEVERVTVRQSGCEPAEITRPAGPFLLAVNDRTGLEGVLLRLASVEGRRQQEVRLPADTRGRRDWRRVVNLPPGAYLLTLADHPDSACRINITAR
jgi:hypothetical protein